MTEDKVEVTAALLAEYPVKAVCPVDTHHADHREEDSHTRTRAAFHAERIELLDRCPCVTAFEEGQRIDCGRCLKHQREMQLDAETCIRIAFTAPGRELAVVIAAKGNGLCRVSIAARHTVAADIECFERRFQVFVIAAQ